MDSAGNKLVDQDKNEFNIVLPSGPPLVPVQQEKDKGLTPFVHPPLDLLAGNWTPQQLQALANQVQSRMDTGNMGEKTDDVPKDQSVSDNLNSTSTATSAGCSIGMGVTMGAGAGSGACASTQLNLSGLDERDKRLAETILAFCSNSKSVPNTPKVEVPGAKAKAELTSDLAKKFNNIQSDVNRLVQCKVFKARLVDRVFKPLDTRSISKFMNTNHIPTWNTPPIQERVKQWSIRGSEMLRQGLLMAIETEMAKLNSRRELIKFDEEKEQPVFEMVREARRALNM